MKVFEYRDYKRFVLDQVAALPKRGRGEFARMAEVAQTHKATISQIFNGEKDLTPEQAVRIAQHLGLRPKERAYFVLLVQYARAGSEDLRILYKEQIDRESAANLEISSRLEGQRDLSDEQRAIFYSNWMYSAIRILTSIPGFQTRNAIAQRLNVPPELVGQILETLLQTGLCIEEGGKLRPGPQNTFIGAKSPLASRHHANWRVKAMERHPMLRSSDELAYTTLVSLSAADAVTIREILARTVEQADKIVGPSACERLYCLSMDWFEV